jgi:hypothetical protein
VKVVVQPEFALSVDDMKNPSAKASALSGKKPFGREVTDEAIRRKEKEIHDASEEARRAEEAAERARLIGMHLLWFSFIICFSFRTNKHILWCS